MENFDDSYSCLSNGRLSNLKKVKKRIKFIKYDLSKKRSLKVFKNFDYIFHLAGLTQAAESVSKPKKYHKANFISTQNILKMINYKKIKKFIYTASASCYGNAKSKLISENSH